MLPRLDTRTLLLTLLAALSSWTASCAVPLGPGYSIEKQQIRIRFTPEPEPRIRIEGEFQMKNTGTQPLQELEMRLPGRRRFHYENTATRWDAGELVLKESSDRSRNMVLTLNEPWRISSRHTLRLEVEFSPAKEGETTVSFSRDAFFLPAAGWSPEFLPPAGLFSSGGVPPKLWELLVAVPEGFEIHTSGREKKSQRKNGEYTVLAEQGPSDPYPFVIAGRYSTAHMGKGKEKVHLWTRSKWESGELREASEAIERVFAEYQDSLGERSWPSEATWIVECPMPANCFTNLNRLTAQLLDEGNERPTAEMISQDTMLVDLSGSTTKLAAMAAPSLAASWLGYGQNPGFYEQQLPLSLLPVFAAALGRTAAAGTESRAETIRHALRLIPANAKPREVEDRAVLRAKSFLFFYALQDHYGRETFRRAIAHMLYARRQRGFELNDLIAAFEQEDDRQNAAEFVRKWMKRPGVPEEFRARYEGSAQALAGFHATSAF